jgi:pimeloyl-ACP methyl ester carboxylesterase
MPDSLRDIRFVNVAGIRIRLREQGAGPALLLINGFGANLEVWDPLARLLGGRRLISFDAPGTGASAPTPRRLRMFQLADLVCALLDQVGLDSVDVLGYSFGGAVAQQLAHQHPNRVRRLILVATIPGVGAVQRPLVIASLLDPRLRSTGDADRRQKQVARLVGGRSGTHADALAVYERNRLLTPTGVSGYRAQLQTLLGWSSIPWLHTIVAPTLVLAGDDDPIVPKINSRVFTRLIPDCRCHLVHGAGHLFPLDQPEDIVGVIDSFLGTASEGKGQRKRMGLRASAATMRTAIRRRLRGRRRASDDVLRPTTRYGDSRRPGRSIWSTLGTT